MSTILIYILILAASNFVKCFRDIKECMYMWRFEMITVVTYIQFNPTCVLDNKQLLHSRKQEFKLKTNMVMGNSTSDILSYSKLLVMGNSISDILSYFDVIGYG